LAQNLRYCNPEDDETLSEITCLISQTEDTERSKEICDIESGPQTRLSLTLVLIFINHADMKGGIKMSHTDRSIINIVKMIMHTASPRFW